MSWHLAHIIRQPGQVTLTLPDVPSIRVEAATLEQAMEMGQRALCDHLDARRALGQPMRKPLTLEEIADHDPQSVYGLLEAPVITGEATITGQPQKTRTYKANRHPHSISARAQLGSLLMRSRMRNTTSPCLFVTSTRQPASSESP